jgi:hypothetical protein
MLNVVDAVTTHRVCPCDCFAELSLADRVAGIRATYKLDDALRGWGYTPIYDVHGDRLWREAQQKNDASYRGVAVRFGECIYRRLLGSLVHECIHAATGDVGTYCFVGGNALVPAIAGYRPVAHVDRQHHPERYYAKARKLEASARAWFDADGNLEGVMRRIDEAAALGEKKRPRRYPDAQTVAAAPPKKIGRNEPCVCGSAAKFKDCCASRETLAQLVPSISR